MNGRGKSDSLIVPVKLSNKDVGALGSAEEVEGRRLVKGNSYQQPRYRTQGREDLQHELGRIRQRKGIRSLGSRRFGITFTRWIVFGRHIFILSGKWPRG